MSQTTWISKAAKWALVTTICAAIVVIGLVVYVIYYAQSLGPIGP